MASVPTALPRVTIQFCTQCKWMLRAAYFAQELLSTFNNALGEVALQPSTGGTFIVSMYCSSEFAVGGEDPVQVQHHVLWDREAEGGFPETKELKKRVRDIIEPGRDLGHIDGKKKIVAAPVHEHPGQDSNKSSAAAEGGKQEQEAEKQEQVRIARVIGNLQVQEQESVRKFTSTDVDVAGGGTNDGNREGHVKRNPDGSICEDCN